MTKTLCIFGDSIAWGSCDPENGGWVARLKRHFYANADDIELYNCGITRDTTSDLLKRFDIEAQARKPDIIIFAIGINDSQYIVSQDNPKTKLEDFRKNLVALTEKAKSHTGEIICIGLTPVDEKLTNPCPWEQTSHFTQKKVEQYDHEIYLTAQSMGVPFLSMKNLLNLSDLEDGLHPNATGHEKMFSSIRDFLNDRPHTKSLKNVR